MLLGSGRLSPKSARQMGIKVSVLLVLFSEFVHCRNVKSVFCASKRFTKLFSRYCLVAWEVSCCGLLF